MHFYSIPKVAESDKFDSIKMCQFSLMVQLSSMLLQFSNGQREKFQFYA